MSYLGRVTNKSSDIRRIDITSSTSATHTLTWTAPTEQSLIVTINGVKQQNNYTVSGTTLTLDTALISTDKLEVIGINDIGTTITPAQGSVNTDQLATDAVSIIKIQDDAVTADKLANAINTSIAANTAKVTNATHTGDVTGATALTIATDAVDIAMLSATGTASSSTFLRGDNAWVAAGVGDGDVTVAKLSTSVTEADNVKQRVAKAWINFNGNGETINDDFNFSSLTDIGTGEYSVAFTANMSSEYYCALGTVDHSSKGVVSISGLATTGFDVTAREANSAILTDYGAIALAVLGELA